MRFTKKWRIRLAQLLLGAVIVIALMVVRGTSAGNEPVHMTTDWSHRHLIFSAPKSVGQHVNLLSNPRYVQQLVRRKAENKGIGDEWRWRRAPEGPTANATPLKGDWSMYLGSGGTVGAGQYPAKYSFDISTANCGTATQPDFVVYNTSLAPNPAGTFASETGTFSGTGATNGQTATITNNNLPAPTNGLVVYANTRALTTASGTITVKNRPNPATTVTVGSVTYAFADTLTAGTTGVIRGVDNLTAAQNLQAAIDDNPSECATANCFASGITTPNPVVIHPAVLTTNVITVTAPIDGASGNFTLSENTVGKVSTGGGANGGGANDLLNFLVVAGDTTATAANMAAAIARSGASIGVTATSAGAVVTVTSLNTGAGATGGVVDISLAAGLNNFTWAGTPLTGGGAGASIVAFDNLYAGCGGTLPSVYWAYNTGGTVATSPTLSADGKQVAFVENIGTTANLVLLKWAASGTATVDAPVTLTDVGNANYRTCTAPCMTLLPFSGGGPKSDVTSSPFYVFSGLDTIYVGDAGDHVRKFTGVFSGMPAEVVTGGWPVTLTGGSNATSPVYDTYTGLVLIGDGSGHLYSVNAAGTQVQSARIDFGAGIVDSPTLDESTGMVYVFSSSNANSAGSSAVYQFAETFAGASSGTSVTIGNATTSRIFPGDFDNIYYTSASGNAGNLYVCGVSAAGGTPTLYQIPITGTGALGTPNIGPALATGTTTCSPITEVYNPNATGGAKDWIFVSVQGLSQTAAPIGCPSANGCIMSFDVTSGAALTTGKTTAATAASEGGASGVVVDNTVGSGALSGTSQVYYTPLGYQSCATSGGIGGCAIQASQSALN